MAAKILVVEDDPAIAENLEALLKARGYQVSLAVDGSEAISVARKEKPQVMLLDIVLPKMGGFDVCRLITSDPNLKDTKIIMITGLGRMGDVETAFKNGATDYLIKPFDSERLFKKLDKVLGAPPA